MFRSLRFRVAALFLAAIVVTGVIAAAIAVGLFQSYARERALKELRRESKGVAELFRREAGVSVSRVVVPRTLQQAIGDRLFYAGLSPFPDPGQKTGLHELPPGTLDREDVFSGRVVTFEFSPPGEDQRLLAVAHPVTLRGHTLGAVIAAKPVTELRNRWLTLIARLAVAFGGGVIAAGALAWYLSRRITRPVLELSAAADEIARRSYDVELPQTRSGDEIGHLAERFREMA
ncbi:MAG: HAMP domain-containing protein, partial [Actinomycetota bacterium]|nr:HAMP domain-containing protein [Actinomycetota bacterium]